MTSWPVMERACASETQAFSDKRKEIGRPVHTDFTGTLNKYFNIT